MLDYYKMFDYVSNSQLGALKDAMFGVAQRENLQDIFDFGNLVDAMVTEPDKLDLESNTMTDQDRVVLFEQEKIEQAKLMHEAVVSDPLFDLLIQTSKPQYVVLRKAHRIEWDGNVFYLPMRMKADLYKPRDLVIDLKTTACETQKQFVASLTHLNYDRQGALYIDLAHVDRILYVGVSKTKNKKTNKHDVFKYMITRDSEMYKSGLAKYSWLGWKYLNYLHFFPTKITIHI